MHKSLKGLSGEEIVKQNIERKLPCPIRTSVAQGALIKNKKLKVGVCDFRGDGLPVRY